MTAPVRFRAARPAERARVRLARVDWPLLAIVALGALWTTWFVLQCKGYFITPDEPEYLRQSRQIARELHPILPGDRFFTSWSQLQPLLLAPVWGAISNTNVAHQVMGIVNAVLMASTAIPAYLLARRVIRPRWGWYLAALLTVAVPWMAAAATMMTEVAAYPAFLWGVLAVQHAIARPSWKADALGLGGVLLAFSARPQLAVLGPALVAGVIVQELRYAGAGDPLTPRRARLAAGLRAGARRHALLLAATVAAALLYAVLRPDVFGGYGHSGVTTGVLSAPGLLDFSRESLAYVAVGAGLLPLALAVAWALQTLWRPLGREQHAFALVAVIAGVLLTIAVGSFSARYTPNGINSRYLFYLVPLLLIGSIALVTERRPATAPLVAGAAGAAWVVFGSQLAQAGPSLVSPDATFHTVLVGRTYQIGRAIGLPQLTVPHLLGVLVLAATLVLALLRRTRWATLAGGAALAFVAASCLVQTGYTFRKIADTQKGVGAQYLHDRRWIDTTLPPGAHATLIQSSFGDPGGAMAAWWDVSFWNEKVDRTATLPTMPDLQQPFPELFAVTPEGTFAPYDSSGAPPKGPGLGDGPWFVRAASDRSFGFRDARVVAELYGVQLVHTASPPRAAWALYSAADDTGRLTAGAPPATLRVFARHPGSAERQRVRLVLTTSTGATRGHRYRIGPRRGYVGRGATAVVRLGVRIGRRGYADVPVRALGTPDPAAPTAGLQLTDVRAG